MSKPDKWRKSIAAMLATAGDSGATDGERETAMGHALHYMQKYGFTASDFEKDGEFDFATAQFTKKRVVLPAKRTPFWMDQLCRFISNFVGGVFYYDALVKPGEKGRSIAWYGPEEQVMSAVEINIRLGATIKKKAQFAYNGWQRGRGADYCLGFVRGLETQLQSQIIALEYENKNLPPAWQKPGLICQNNALILKLQNWANDRLSSEYNIKLQNVRTSGGSRNLDGQAFENGKREGASHDSHKATQAKIG